MASSPVWSPSPRRALQFDEPKVRTTTIGSSATEVRPRRKKSIFKAQLAELYPELLLDDDESYDVNGDDGARRSGRRNARLDLSDLIEETGNLDLSDSGAEEEEEEAGAGVSGSSWNDNNHSKYPGMSGCERAEDSVCEISSVSNKFANISLDTSQSPITPTKKTGSCTNDGTSSEDDNFENYVTSVKKSMRKFNPTLERKSSSPSVLVISDDDDDNSDAESVDSNNGIMDEVFASPSSSSRILSYDRMGRSSNKENKAPDDKAGVLPLKVHGVQNSRATSCLSMGSDSVFDTPLPVDIREYAKANGHRFISSVPAKPSAHSQRVPLGEVQIEPSLSTSPKQQHTTSDPIWDKDARFLVSLSADYPSGNRCPEAVPYVNRFQRYRHNLADYLYALFNRRVFDCKLPHHMQIQWHKRLRTTAGHTIYRRSLGQRTAGIDLSIKVCDSAERVRDTLIHEMCHAMVWIVHGIKIAHGKHWKFWARHAMRVFPQLPPVRRCHDYSVRAKYIYRCIQCGYQVSRHSKSLDTTKYACGICEGLFELYLNGDHLSFQSGSQSDQGVVTPALDSHHTSMVSNQTPARGGNLLTPVTPCRTPGPFALFVQANYASVKKSHGSNVAHGDIMRMLSVKFKRHVAVTSQHELKADDVVKSFSGSEGNSHD